MSISKSISNAADLSHSSKSRFAAERNDATRPQVAFVDNQRLSRECLATLLQMPSQQKWSVCSFPTISEAIARPEDSPSVVVNYIHQDLENEIAAALRALEGSNVSLIVVTDYSSEKLAPIARLVIQSGIRGLLSTANSGIGILNAAIDFVLSGGTFIPHELLVANPLEVKTKVGGKKLTGRQSEVFAKLKEGKPNKIIAYELGMSESTTKVHVRNIMSKFGATNRTQAAFVGNAWV
jgi:DNA-binding NarL/FixJ family response regulator